MCCKNFGKRVVTFLIAFSIGLFIANLFSPKPLPKVEVKKQEEKKCEYAPEFKKYDDFTVEMLEEEYLRTILMRSEVVIWREDKSSLTREEKEILRRNLATKERKKDDFKLFILKSLIRFKRGEIKELPFPKICR